MIFKQQLLDFRNKLQKFSKKIVSSYTSLQNVSKDIVIEKFTMNDVFKLLFEKFKCQIKLKTISKCVLLNLSSLISNISIWQTNDMYCDVLNHDFDAEVSTKNVIRRANHFVRMIVFKKKILLMNEHDSLCDLRRVLFIPEFQIATNRKVRFNHYLNEKRYNLKKYHEFFLQFLKKWIFKRVLWKFQTIAH